MMRFICTLLVLGVTTNAIPHRFKLSNSYMKEKHIFEERIVGGEVVEPNSIPFQISLQTTDGFHFCGGSVMDKDTIITAGHCCDVFPAAEIQVIAGEHDFDTIRGDEQKASVDKITYHEFFATHGANNDICLLKLSSSLELNDKVQPVALPEKDQEFTGDVVVSGWGTTFFTGAPSPVLRSVTVQIMSVEDCKRLYGDAIDETMICAAAPGKDSCQGDSGGPLVQDGILVGIVSWGYGCADIEFPRVYLKISKFIDWIEKNQ